MSTTTYPSSHKLLTSTSLATLSKQQILSTMDRAHVDRIERTIVGLISEASELSPHGVSH